MPKFKKKPVVIEAVQWTGGNHREMFNFLGGKDDDPMQVFGDNFLIDYTKSATGLVIRTLEGDMVANAGDWIIRGVKGEYYPCKPDIFESTYDPA